MLPATQGLVRRGRKDLSWASTPVLPKGCRIKMARRLPRPIEWAPDESPAAGSNEFAPPPKKGAESRWHGGCQSSLRSPRLARGEVGATARDANVRDDALTYRTRRAPSTILATPFTSRCAMRGLKSFRSDSAFAALLQAFSAAIRDGFRVTHFSVQTDHVHLIVEADSSDDLRRGLNGLGCRAARALNRAWGRRGAIWGDRYHARPLRTPREMRGGLVYVLLNFRKHLRAPPCIDPRSSGAWFDGWARPPPAAAQPCPVATPRTWLGSVGWRRGGGPVDIREMPAPK